MKQNFILIFVIGIFLGGMIGLHYDTIDLFRDNNKKYKYFMDKQLVGIDGKVNLSGIEVEEKNIKEELFNLFQQDKYNYNNYLKIMEDKRRGNDLILKEIDILTTNINELERKSQSLNSEYNVLVNKYNKLKKPSNVVVSTNNNYKFPLINQYPKYQTGCESVALTMLLRYHGVNVTPDMIIEKVKKGSLPYWENGLLYGGNPELEFVGNPYSTSSYGVYEKPMAEVANIFKSGVYAKSNFSFSEVINLVKNGTPVMVWTSMGLALPYISHSWVYKPTGEIINWKANEHAVVMIDATDSTVIIADPMGGRLKTYSRSLFEQRYNYFGKKVLYYL